MSHWKKFWSVIGIIALILSLFVGTATAKKDVLVVMQEAEPVGLDLMRSSIQTTMSVCYNIHDTLFAPQEDASVKPRIAESWEKVDDLTWKIDPSPNVVTPRQRCHSRPQPPGFPCGGRRVGPAADLRALRGHRYRRWLHRRNGGDDSRALPPGAACLSASPGGQRREKPGHR